jgi:hypothetical protein
MSETELIIDYSRSPIVIGDANDDLSAGFRLPDRISVQWQVESPVTQPRGLHQLAHNAGHTLMLLGGPAGSGATLIDLHATLQKFADDTPLFDAAVTLSTSLAMPVNVGQLNSAATDLLGVEAITLLAMRPDGYVGMRSDKNHLAALERYRDLVHTGKA